MASHARFKPVRHAGIASQDQLFISAAAIVEGAPVIFSSGKVTTVADHADGAGLLSSGKIIGVALHAASAANEDIRVALALPGRRFVGSLTDISTTSASDGSTVALALDDIGDTFEMHLDATTAIWVLGAASGTEGTNAAPRIMALVDKVGATTGDTRTFGSSGTGTGVTPATSTPPGSTFEQNPPAGPNSGQAKVEFVFVTSDTIFG